MIKKYKEFIFEDEDDDGGTSSASPSTSTDTSFKGRFEKFKEFLAKKSTGSGSSASSSPTDGSAPRTYTSGSGDFSNVDVMIETVVSYLIKHGITNPIVQRAILATIGKESGFTATKEAS